MKFYEYTYKHKGVDDEVKKDYLLYTFKSDILKQVYFVYLYKFPYNIYILKFHLKADRWANNRYINMTFKRFDDLLGVDKRYKYTENFIYILNTLFEIVKDVKSKDKIASFGFMGVPREDEESRTKEDNTVSSTKRYLVYKGYLTRYLSPEDFEHLDSETSSIYVLMNKSNTALNPEIIENYIQNNIIPTL